MEIFSENETISRLRPNEKFVFTTENDEYYFIVTTDYEYVVWNDTKKVVRKIKKDYLEIHRI
jgi:hypothetical protein